MSDAPLDEFRCDVVSSKQLRELAAAPLPGGLRAGAARRQLFRDLYLDTADGTLRRRGVTCRLRISADDRRVLSLLIGDPGPSRFVDERHHARVRSTDPAAAVREQNRVTRRLGGIVDSALLTVRVAMEVERYTRPALRDWLGRPAIELHYDSVTVRRNELARTFQQISVHRRREDGGAVARLARAFELELGLRPLATDRLERAELLLKWMPATNDAPALPESMTTTTADHAVRLGDAEFLDPELSFLAFQERVVALAEDPATPLAERLRFLAIVAANLDEFFTIRVAGLKSATPEMIEESAVDGMRPADQLSLIATAAEALVARQYRAFAAWQRDALPAGIRIRRWAELSDAERESLREVYREDIHAELTPLAMTMSPGHPFPKLPHLLLQIATVLVDPHGGAPHFAQVDVPESLPRFLQVGDDPAAGVIPVEEVIRANLDVLYPNLRVEQAYFFRVTRGGDLRLDEANAANLLHAVADATKRRGETAVVRVEIERAMPEVLRDLVLQQLRREAGPAAAPLGPDDVFEIDGLLALGDLAQLDLPDDPAVRYPPFVPAVPVPAGESLLDVIGHGDLLVHHPFESFVETVRRFIVEAADDPDVTVIKMTLYRSGERSPIVEALRRAAANGKQVYAFVEVRARFDEERNVKWVRALQDAGVHVVYGLRGLKTHAKAALVVRREALQLRRYGHVGTGNYNVQTGLAYTDLSLFTADEAITADLADLFNSLTGTSTAPARMQHGSLVAPTQLLESLLEQIDREAAHARAGREALIRIKVNGLSDTEVVRALARAAQDGVRIDLAVRGICTLRPGVPGYSDPIRVVATTGRFLEHSRIFHFANGGDPLYFIGSADLRPRNLRRRVELLVPVRDRRARGVLRHLLDLYMSDPTGWELERTGTYVRRHGAGTAAQAALLAELTTGVAGDAIRPGRSLAHGDGVAHA